MMLRSPNPLDRANGPLFRIALASVLSLGLLGCSSNEGDDKAPTQVAAKVGDSEISVHQINQVLGRTPMRDTTKEALQAASNRILESLIDQQLAVDAATENKLHRSPEVVAAIEAARNEVLARAYLQRITSAATKATPEEVKTYYAENPALFSERRNYNLQEIRIPDAGPVLAELRGMAEQGRPIDQIASFLRERQIPFTGGGATRSAEQIQLEILPRLHATKDGQYLVVDNGKSATLIRVAASQSVPLSEEQARGGIEQFMNNRRASEAIAQEIKRLRESNTIAYMGNFSKPTSVATDTAASPGVPAGTPPATGSPAAPSAAVGAAPDSAAIERGIQGIK